MVELRLLGPVQMWVAGKRVDLGPPKQRVVLAALAVEANQPVPVPVLVDRVWDQAPPRGARQVLYNHLSVIRRMLRQAAAADGESAGLLRRGGGYLLEVDPGRVDAHRFRRLVEQASGRDTPAMARAALLRQALDLWRGPALADVTSAWGGHVRHAWVQQRMAAARLWAEIELRAGRPGPVVDQLVILTAEHPLAEPLLALLLHALHADGRDAEALQQYAVTRRRLAEELGVDPGSELRAVHQAILQGTLPPPVPVAGQLTTAGPAVAASGSRPPAAAPAQLPADVCAFAGRTAELADLDRLLDAEPAEDGSVTGVVICGVCGTAGVGKTALAVHWAHRVRDAFPDGQLYVNLRGYDPDQPLPGADALAGFLSALGVAGRDIPLGVEDRAARYRSEISGRRMLVVLDNVASVEQVRPLLPGTGSCLVLVTSRDSLAGLVALHGAHRLDLELLPAADAVALLRRLIGARAEAEPEAAAALAEQCARLPLALRVAAELAAARSGMTLACVVDELADQQRRLDLLDAGGDARAAVRGVFSWSYQRLPAAAARAFRLLGLHPGPDFDAYAAAALTGAGLTTARGLLDLLTHAHLINPTRPGRYGMHDLLRAYATRLPHRHDGHDDRQAALTRLFDQYLAAAAAAMDTLHPAEAHHRPRIPPAGSPTPPVAEPVTALAWLDTERPNLIAASTYTATHGWPEHTIRLATTLFRYLDAGGHYPDALTIHANAHHAASDISDQSSEAHALNSLAGVHFRQGRYGVSADHLQQALTHFRRTADRNGQARTLGNLGIVEWRRGRYRQAAGHYQDALRLHRETGDRDAEADVLDHLGLIHGRTGQYGVAAEQHQQALSLYRKISDRTGEATALTNLGLAYGRQGRDHQAADHLQQALSLCRATGNRSGEADALTNLGLVYGRQNLHALAANHHLQALSLDRQIGDRSGETEVLNNLGETLHATGHHDQAGTQHTAALDLAVNTGDRYEQARAHAGLGHAHQATGDLDHARHHWRQAFTVYTDLGLPEADDIRAHLAALDQLAV